MRKCKKHEIVICNEADNNGKYYCPKCGVIPKSRTYTDSDSESAPQGKNPVGGSSPDEIEVHDMTVSEMIKFVDNHPKADWVIENRADKVFIVRKKSKSEKEITIKYDSESGIPKCFHPNENFFKTMKILIKDGGMVALVRDVEE